MRSYLTRTVMGIFKQFLIIILSVISFNTIAQMWTINKRVEPKYPLQAVKNNIEGCAVVQFFIDDNGVPTFVEPIQSFPSEDFATEAYKAVSQWRYTAAESNSNNLPQRQVVQLDFALSKNSLINDQCQKKLTDESDDINQFKINRLSTPINGSSNITLKESIASITAVLSTTELKQFFYSYSELLKSKNKMNTAYEHLNGLSYQQILTMANLTSSELDGVDQTMQERTTRRINKLPLVSFKELFNRLEVSDMRISMEESLYKEISYQLLKAEILVRRDGTAELISMCREVSSDISKAIKTSIADWRIRSKSNQPQAVRFIYGIPAPVEAGAFYDCDANWYPEHKAQLPVMASER